MEKILLRIESYTAQGVRGAELAISGVSLLFSIPLGANAPAILLVGPTIGRPLGVRHKLAPARIANLMDCSVNTMFYILPWHNAVIVWFITLTTVSQQYDIVAPSLTASLMNPYSWALIVVLFISIVTGWNRTYAEPQEDSAQQATT